MHANSQKNTARLSNKDGKCDHWWWHIKIVELYPTEEASQSSTDMEAILWQWTWKIIPGVKGMSIRNKHHVLHCALSGAQKPTQRRLIWAHRSVIYTPEVVTTHNKVNCGEKFIFLFGICKHTNDKHHHIKSHHQQHHFHTRGKIHVLQHKT